MRLKIARNFLTSEECVALNEWAAEGVKHGWLDTGISRGNLTRTRLTSRMYGARFTTPKIVSTVSKKIRQYVGVQDYPLVAGHGKDGVVVSCTYNNGDVYEHQDPRSFPDLATLRCNVMTQKPVSGGLLYLEGQEVPLEAGDLHCYLASEHKHAVTTVLGETPRILWMFGACVPIDDWNSGKIELGEACGVS